MEAITAGGLACLIIGLYYHFRPQTKKKVIELDSFQICQTIARRESKCKTRGFNR